MATSKTGGAGAQPPKPQAPKQLVIEPVLVTEQFGNKIYTFNLPARELIALAIVERFGREDTGVNRQLNEKHMLDIAQAMANKQNPVLWMEPIIVDIRGFEFRDGKLYAGHGAKLSVDDGQHRVEALKTELLTAAELDELSFTVTGTIGLEYEMRLRIFRMQSDRREIDSRLDLAQRHRLKLWASDIDREAYELVLKLNTNPLSPLCNRVQLDERQTQIVEAHGLSPNGINARGLYSTIRMLCGRRSPLCGLTLSKREEVLLNTLRTAADIWKSQWRSDKHILTTARGINAVLSLYVGGTSFRQRVGMQFTEENIRAGLLLGKPFDWSCEKATNQSVRQIMERLDQSIGRGLSRVIAAGNNPSASDESTIRAAY